MDNVIIIKIIFLDHLEHFVYVTLKF